MLLFAQQAAILVSAWVQINGSPYMLTSFSAHNFRLLQKPKNGGGGGVERTRLTNLVAYLLLAEVFSSAESITHLETVVRNRQFQTAQGNVCIVW